MTDCGQARGKPWRSMGWQHNLLARRISPDLTGHVSASLFGDIANRGGYGFLAPERLSDQRRQQPPKAVAQVE